MANQNDNPTVADLDLSGIEGFGDGGSVDESPIDAGNYEAVEAPESEVESSDYDDAEYDDGPISWSSVEGLVPEPLHEELRPMVEEWRRQYERVLDETSPYRQYSEAGVSPQDMELAIQIQQALLSDPKSFYDNLGRTYGWTDQQQNVAQQYAQYAQQTPPQQQQPASEWDSFFGEEGQQEQAPQVDQRLLYAIEQQQQRLAQLEEMQYAQVEAQRQAQIEDFGRQQLEGELAGIEAKYGQFDRAEVVKRAIANASSGGDPSVMRAFHELKDYEDRLRRQFVSTRPPKVMGSGTGVQPPVPTDLSTEEAKRDAALALAIRLGADNPTSYQR